MRINESSPTLNKEIIMIRRSLFAALALPLASVSAHAQSFALGEVNDALGLNESRPVQVLLEGQPGSDMLATVVLDGQPVSLDLRPHEGVLSPNFELIEQRGDGSYHTVSYEAPPVYRGATAAFGGAQVAAAWLEDGLHARLLTESGEDLWIQPVPEEEGGLFGDHVLYTASGVKEHGGLCGLDDIAGGGDPIATSGGGSSIASSGLLVAELACDADFEYYQDYGSSTTQVMNRITSVIDTMNLQYENQTGITHQLTTIIVRTSSNDPYTSSNASTLLNQFRSEWQSNQGSVQRDVAQLFTGKSIQGGTIGIAWLASVCGSFAYSVVESDFNNNFSCSTDLSAHELGHNWSANHCFCNTTMSSFITCANNFGNGSINAITNFANNVGCLGASACTTTGTATLFNGGGSNTICLQSVSSPIIGQDFNIEVDGTGIANASSSIVIGRAQSSSGTFIGTAGEILVNINSSQIFTSVQNGAFATHTYSIPNSGAMVGTTFTIQGAVRKSVGIPTLCNAENVIIGCQ